MNVPLIFQNPCLFWIFSNKYFPDLHDNVPTLNYYVTPVVAIVIGTYFITSSFFGVYEMAVDTLFLCFLEGKQGKLVVLHSLTSWCIYLYLDILKKTQVKWILLITGFQIYEFLLQILVA